MFLGFFTFFFKKGVYGPCEIARLVGYALMSYGITKCRTEEFRSRLLGNCRDKDSKGILQVPFGKSLGCPKHII